jgi:outer membrane protein
MTMKKMTLIAAVMAASISFPALAAETPIFGVVDMNKVMQKTDAAKDIFGQLEDKRKEYQAQISKEENTLRSAEKEIIKQKDSLSKDEFERKRKEFEEKVMDGQKLVQERKKTLDTAFSGSMTSLRNEAAKIIAEIAKEKHLSAVLSEEAVLLSTPDLDITDAVIEKLNKHVKKMPVNWVASKGDKKK